MITPHTIGNMDQVVKKVIFNSEGIEPEPTNVGDNTVTYGYGYTFIRKGDKWNIYGNLYSDLAAIGITLNADEKTKLQSIAYALNQNNISLACTLIVQFQEDWRYADLTEPEANTLYNLEINRKKEELSTQFRKVLGTTNGNALLSGLQNSKEMVTLLDMAYNGGAGLVGPKLINAMWEGNRAEAWFEIRYNSNNGRDLSMRPGLAKRRYLESQMFGLYDNPDSVGLTEAQQIYKMLQEHRGEIVYYEKNYGVPVDGTSPLQGNRIDAARNDFSGLLSYVQSGTVQTIEESLNLAKAAIFTYINGRDDLPGLLKDKLTENNVASTNIYLNPHKDTDLDQTSVLDSFFYQTGLYENGANDLMIGMDQSDFMFGRKGNDVLIGEGGSDCLWGDEGNDVLFGGGGGIRRTPFLPSL